MNKSKFTVVKDDEFAVLCALYGINHFFGSLEMREEKLSRQEIYGLLYQVYMKELILYDKDKVIFNEDVKILFEGLRGATRLLSFVNPLTSENHSFYYAPSKELCINLQKGWEDPHSIRLRHIDKDEVIKICEEAELLPKQTLSEDSMWGIKLSEEVEMTSKSLEMNLYDLTSDKRLVEVMIGMEALNNVLVYVDETKTYKEIYVLEHLKRLITTLLQGETHDDNG